MDRIPPPIVSTAKVLVYAVNDSDVEYTDKIDLHVGTKEQGLQRLGEVPHLVISTPYNQPEDYLLMFCDSSWEVLGVIAFTTIEEAKIKAERGYSGISDKWISSPYSTDQIDEFLRSEYQVDPKSEWWTTICSFCGRKDTELESVIVGKYASICKECALSYAEVFREDR